MPKVIFKIDPEKEYEYHKLFFEHHGLDHMSLFRHQSIEDKKRIIRKINSFWDETDKKVFAEVENQWRTIENQYFPLIEEITEEKWASDTFYAYCLAFSNNTGYSSPYIPDSREISFSTGAIINPKFIIGHELFHTHFYHVIHRLGLDHKAKNTLFNEGTAALVLFKTKAFELFPNTHPQSSIDSHGIVSRNWPTLVNLWEKRTSFKGFLEEAYTEFKDQIVVKP
jgi:hypothetical protein